MGPHFGRMHCIASIGIGLKIGGKAWSQSATGAMRLIEFMPALYSCRLEPSQCTTSDYVRLYSIHSVLR